MPAGNEERERLEGEERLEGLLGNLPRERAPEGLWEQLAVSLGPEAKASRELARRRQQFVGGLVAVAASVLVAVGVWYWFALTGTVEQPVTPTAATRPAVVGRTAAVPVGPVPSVAVALVDREGEALGQVHVVYEASNFLPGEMVLATAGDGYENW
jgi:hypothetical protein